MIGAGRWRPAVFKVRGVCSAFSFSAIRTGDGIASEVHLVHSSTNDIE
jgi:hypothetical protein